MKILLVEDDEFIAQTLESILRDRHYIVDRASEGKLGWEFVETYNYDLILLDIILPELDGIEFCKKLRSAGNQTPVLLLTAQNSSNKKVMGLDAGADDYVVKPFEISELLARIRVLLRRRNSLTLPILQWGKLRLNSSTHEVTYNHKIINLTPKEYRLLELFLDNGDRVLTRDVILDRLWDVEEIPSDNAVSVHIKDLRRKLKQAGANTDPIETVYGVGYRLKPITTITASINDAHKSEKSLQKQTVRALDAVWKKFEGLNSDRLEVLQQANLAWQENSLGEELLTQAKWAAHRLAGGLGVFGFIEGSRIATEIEQLLKIQSTSASERAKQFSELLVALTNSLKPNLDRSISVNLNQPFILAIDDRPQLVESIIAELTAIDMSYKLVTKLTDLDEALVKNNLDVVVWKFSLADLSEKSFNDFANIVKDIIPLSVILFTDSDSFSDRLKINRLGNNLFLKQSSLSPQAIAAIVEAIYKFKHKIAKVLVVDDDPEILAVIRNLIEPWGIDLTTLDNPAQFWQIIAELDPDLLILDISMPHCTGIELCQLVRNDHRWHELPILFFTVHNDLTTLHKVLTAGANDCISKTFAQSELVTKVLSHLNRRELLRAI